MLERLWLVENVLLIFLIYSELDVFCEGSNIVICIGIIKCGIGLVYEDKVVWCGLCVIDLVLDVIIEEKIDGLFEYYNVFCCGYG